MKDSYTEKEYYWVRSHGGFIYREIIILGSHLNGGFMYRESSIGSTFMEDFEKNLPRISEKFPKQNRKRLKSLR